MTTTAADACMHCHDLCQTCPVDNAGEWPTRDQGDIAAAEAAGPAYAGADTPTPHAAIAATAAAHARWRTRSHNQARYGPGGLFDNLPIEAAS
jgi:hypothetical protein